MRPAVVNKMFQLPEYTERTGGGLTSCSAAADWRRSKTAPHVFAVSAAGRTEKRTSTRRLFLLFLPWIDRRHGGAFSVTSVLTHFMFETARAHRRSFVLSRRGNMDKHEGGGAEARVHRHGRSPSHTDRAPGAGGPLTDEEHGSSDRLGLVEVAHTTAAEPTREP